MDVSSLTALIDGLPVDQRPSADILDVLDFIDGRLRQLEGGFVDDPRDRGGPTNHGISLRYARGIGLDLDGDRDTDIDDIRLVTPDVARACFLRDFYLAPRINLLPAILRPMTFDFAINSGPYPAISRLQMAVQAMGAPCTPDGLIGTRTIRALRSGRLIGANYAALRIHYVQQRVRWVTDIVAADPAQGRYLRGWLARARSFLP